MNRVAVEEERGISGQCHGFKNVGPSFFGTQRNQQEQGKEVAIRFRFTFVNHTLRGITYQLNKPGYHSRSQLLSRLNRLHGQHARWYVQTQQYPLNVQTIGGVFAGFGEFRFHVLILLHREGSP